MTRRVRVGFSRRGMGLVEIMITASIIAVIALGLATLFKDVFTVQNRSNLGATANQLKNLMEAAIKDGKAWGHTVTANASLTCLDNTNSTQCTSGAAITGIDLKQSDSTTLLNNSSAANGFTTGGAACNSWSAGGNNACPFSYDITVRLTCMSGATCKNPNVRVEAVMKFSPLDQEMKSAIATGAIGSASGKYNVVVDRGASNTRRNDPFLVRHRITGATSTSYGGACTVNAWNQRTINEEVGDTANNVAVASNQFTLEAGTYECRATAPAFKAGVNKIRVRDTGSTIIQESASVIAPVSGGSSIAVVDINISINAATTFLVEHFCSQAPTNDTDGFGLTNASAALGVPSAGTGGTYSEVIYTVVSCVRTS
jgi:Tfp pilus assembly protein PilV